MNSAPHLLNEDRPDFDHIVDEALRIVLEERQERLDRQDREGGLDRGDGGILGLGRGEPGDRAGSRAAGGDGPLPSLHHPLNSEQLRTKALGAAELIGARAAVEYEAYRKVREATREAARESARARDNRTFGYAAMGVADGAGSGAGLAAVIAVLTPLLAGAAAVIFLLIGYSLRAMTPVPAIASPLRTAGWLFAAVTAASILLGAIGLMLTALRDGSAAIHDSPDAMPPEVAQAREIWHQALLERGLLPFLEEAAANAALAPTTGHDPAAGDGRPPGARPSDPAAAPRMPRLGYSRPDFSSPSPDHTPQTPPRYSGPRYSSPDFSSPDFGGPENEPQ
ncbi:hypothetical protein AB0M29_02895 [Streptomyces sp. NPDC051976]|uniref:hypothetical protein n=1 Tax=Streptomyces sp. NPDC051976 TaxID=3154947 RepID=UPI00344765D5